jgi:hypothetical protein
VVAAFEALYTMLFSVAGACAVAGAAVILHIRGVR